MSRLSAFNFKQWIDEYRHLLKPPVGNKLIWEDAGLMAFVVGGPNQRTDYHDDPVEEFFYQLEGDMVLKIHDNGDFYDVVIGEGEVFMLPAHVRHSPQRPMAGSVGLVIEPKRPSGEKDAFGNVRLGGIGNVLANEVEKRTGCESRAVVLGHTQRGGTPTAFDRVLSTRYGIAAIDMVANGEFGKMTALRGQEILPVTLEDATAENRTLDMDLYETAKIFFN